MTGIFAPLIRPQQPPKPPPRQTTSASPTTKEPPQLTLRTARNLTGILNQMSDLAKPKRGRKRGEDNRVREFFSRKMAWLTQRCRDPFVLDSHFRVLFALVIEWLDNESNWCKPTDEKLGESCAKSERTVQRITAELKREEHIEKRKRLGPSEYVFIGLTDAENELTPANLDGCERPTDKSRPAILGIKTRHIGYEDPPPVGRTKPSDLPSDLPTDSDGFAAVSENKKEAISGEQVGKSSPFPQPRSQPECPSSVEEVVRGLRRDLFN